MKRYGITYHVILVCRSLFDKNSANLVVDGRSSRDIHCRKGLLQGASLSPLLFNVYVNPLLVRLNDGVLSSSLFSADDGAVHALMPRQPRPCWTFVQHGEMNTGWNFMLIRAPCWVARRRMLSSVCSDGVILLS